MTFFGDLFVCSHYLDILVSLKVLEIERNIVLLINSVSFDLMFQLDFIDWYRLIQDPKNDRFVVSELLTFPIFCYVTIVISHFLHGKIFFENRIDLVKQNFLGI